MALLVSGCAPPQLSGPALAAPSTAEAFDAGKCDAAHPPRDPDLMAWDSTSRAALAAVRRQGIAVVRYEGSGCDAQLELLSGCVAKGTYDFVPYWESKSKLANNASDLHANLPVGGAGLTGELQGHRSLRTDYMLTGLVQTPIGSNFQVTDLVGDCARATHLVTRIYLGGFAMASGERRTIEASASLFSASAGGKSDASLEQLERAGDAAACEASHASQTENASCAVPLRIGLLPLAQARACVEPTECESRCAESDPGSCVLLASMYVNGDGVAKDPRRAVTLLKRACDQGDQNGCGNLGLMYTNGTGVPRDPGRGFLLLNQACEKEFLWACVELGTMYELGIGVQQDRAHAASLYGPACDAGNPDACARRVPLLQVECDGGQAQDCLDLALMYAKGRGVPVDYHAAMSLLQRSCEHGSDVACTEVGTFYIRGLGVPKDASKGIAAYKDACDKARPAACAALGMTYASGEAVGKNSKLAASYFERGCSLGSALCCGALGGLYEDGDGVKRDLARAVSLYTDSCDHGESGACSALASLFEKGQGVRADASRALALYQQACKAGDEDACRAATRLAGVH
ncbi:MAG: tetratricopeptide repeat protein [Polyangiaceae bacterium]